MQKPIPRSVRHTAHYDKYLRTNRNIMLVFACLLVVSAWIGYRASDMALFWIFWLVLVVFLYDRGYAIVMAHTQYNLLRGGSFAKGYVTRQDFFTIKGTTYYRLHFSFTLPDSRPFSRIQKCPRAFFLMHPGGTPLTILYDPDNPKRCVPYTYITFTNYVEIGDTR